MYPSTSFGFRPKTDFRKQLQLNLHPLHEINVENENTLTFALQHHRSPGKSAPHHPRQRSHNTTPPFQYSTRDNSGILKK